MADCYPTKWTPTVDRLQRARCMAARRRFIMVNWGARLIPNSEMDAQASFNNATARGQHPAAQANATPCQYNNYLHRRRTTVATACSASTENDARPVEDIDSVWTDGISNRWVLVTIVARTS